ncbi:MAG: OmpA family protein [Bacteroidales bacterium]|nr:OmpA family protein [Bacteroidales bacterium]
MTKTLIKPKKTLFTLLFSLLGLLSYGQFVLSPEEQYIEGEEFILSEECNEALPFFRQLYDKGFKTANISYKIGYCYLFSPGRKENAIGYLETACKKASGSYIGKSPSEDKAPLDALLYLGMAYRINYQFEKCFNILNILKDSVDSGSELYARADLEIKQCENAISLVEAEIMLKKTPVDEGINNTSSNFNPLVTSDETQIYYMEALKFYDAVMNAVKASGSWTLPDNITANLRSDGDFFVTGLSKDGNTLLLQMYDPYSRGDIYMCEKKDGKWEQISKLNDNINTLFNETHASFANNGKTLIFTSNKPGGYGGLDIYRSEMNSDGEWSPAINLGPAVNTAMNEETPFVTDDNKRMWFSSMGHYNMGGYDIFYSDADETGNWGNPSNAGYPLNTSDDDLFYFPVKDGNTGYHAKYSDNLFGSMDIFRFELLSKANPARFNVRGQLKPKGDQPLPYERIEIALVDKLADDTLSIKKTEPDGKYTYKLPSGEYELNFFADKEYLDKKNISLPDYLTVNDLIIDTELDESLLARIATSPDMMTLQGDQAQKEPAKHQEDTIIIRHILFGFDRFAISAADIEYITGLTELLQKYPDVKIIINGYTDAIGDASYNKGLSVKRAQRIRDLMVAAKIDVSRIDVNGLGEEAPVAVNNNADGTDNPNGRKYNRRVEIELDRVPEYLIIIYMNNVPEELLFKKN